MLRHVFLPDITMFANYTKLNYFNVPFLEELGFSYIHERDEKPTYMYNNCERNLQRQFFHQ